MSRLFENLVKTYSWPFVIDGIFFIWKPGVLFCYRESIEEEDLGHSIPKRIRTIHNKEKGNESILQSWSFARSRESLHARYFIIRKQRTAPSQCSQRERKIRGWMPRLGWDVPTVQEEKRDRVMLPTFERKGSLFVSPLELDEVGRRRKVGEKE